MVFNVLTCGAKEITDGEAGKVCRMATREDIPAIADLKYKMFREIGMEDLLREDFAEMVIKTYLAMYRDGTAQHYIIEADGGVVACAGAFLKEDIPYCFYKQSRYGFIGDVYVQPEYRRRGYSLVLIKAVLMFFTGLGIRTVRLLASEGAHSIYKSLGFRETDEMILHLG